MVDIVFGRLRSKAIDNLLIAKRSQRRDRHDLSLSTREQAGAMRTRQQADFAADRTDFLYLTPIWTDFLVRDHMADDLFLEIMQGHSDLLIHLRIIHEEMLHDIGIDIRNMGITVQLIRVTGSFIQTGHGIFTDALLQFLRNREQRNITLFLAAFFLYIILEVNDTLNFLVTKEDCIEDHVLWQFTGTSLNHHDGIMRAGNRQVQSRNLTLLLSRVDDEFIIDTTDTDAGNRAHERDIRNRQGC